MSTESTLRTPGYRPALIATLLMTLLVSVLIGYLWNVLYDERQLQRESAFRNEITEIVTAISEHMDAYELVLRGGQSFFMSSQEVSRDMWHTYVTQLHLEVQYSGIQGVGFAAMVSAAARAAHEQRIRSEGFPDYRIWPEGNRGTYSSIIFLEPFDWRNQRAFGYDMFTEPTRHEAMARARDTGMPALSGKVLLVQETDEAPQSGTLLYVPLYQKGVPLDSVAQRQQALLGWVYSPYRMNDLLKGLWDYHYQDVRMRIFDQQASDPENPGHATENAENLLYDSLSGHQGEDQEIVPVLQHTEILEIAGRTWRLDFEASPSFAQSTGFSTLDAEVAGMGLIGLLLIMLTWNLFNTQRKTSIQANDLTLSLRRSQEQFKSLFRNMTEGVALHEMVHDPDGRAIDYRIIDINPAYETQTGLSAAAAKGQLASKVYGTSPAPYLKEFGCVAESRIPLLFETYFPTLKRHFDISVFSPKENRFATVLTDITERKQTEETLRKLSRAIEQAGEAIVITDIGGIIEYANPAFTKLTGYSAEEVLSKNPRILKSGKQSASFYKQMWDTILGGNIWQVKMINRKKDGALYPTLMTISPIRNEVGKITHFVGLQQDLSENEELEQRYYQAQKMESLGTLVGGIAHEFNNALAGITGNLYLVRKRISNQPEVTKKLDTIENLAFRSAELIKNLLSFARKGIVQKKSFDLPSFTQEIIKMHRVTLPEYIKLDVLIDTPPMKINWDMNMLQQVMMNLINNSRDACRNIENAVISIRLDKFSPDHAFLDRHPDIEAGRYACLSIRDNGVGIDIDMLPHIFEPFFTSKEIGHGTGLGLSMVIGAVQTHHGCIEVESTEGEGSVFSLYLPLSEEEEELSSEARQKDTVTYGKGETILFADDETSILEVGSAVLESMGYHVLTASDGLQAVEMFKARKDDISIVIADIMMPGLGGLEAVEQIRKLKPGIKAIFTTGYNKDDERFGSIHAGESILHKPYDIDELNRLIRRQVDTQA